MAREKSAWLTAESAVAIRTPAPGCPDGDELLAHLERHLGGAASEGWLEAEGGEPLSVPILRFDDQPGPGVDTLVTMGLSRWELDQGDGEGVLQELVLCAERSLIHEVRPLLFGVALQVLESGEALWQGQVMGPAGPIFEGSELEAFYCTSPRFFPSSFDVFSRSTPLTAFVWLVPITAGEATFIAANGWGRFEEEIETRRPDVFDLRRASFL